MIIVLLLSSCKDEDDGVITPSISILVNGQEVETYDTHPNDELVIDYTLRYIPKEEQYIATYLDDFLMTKFILDVNKNLKKSDVTISLGVDASGTKIFAVEYIDEDEVVLRETIDLVIK